MQLSSDTKIDKSFPQKIRIAHLVNCFLPSPDSEFTYVQPITLASMLRAKAESAAHIEVELLSAQTENAISVVPSEFIKCPNLSRDVRDIYQDKTLPPFPLLADLLVRLYENSDAEYLIYTNLDIGLQPHFYNQVAEMIAAGHDAFIINRRRIPAHFRTVDELEQMYQERGKPHPGFDCFVFHRSLFPKLILENICIGIPFVEILMGQNLFANAQNFKLLEDEYLTFHIGEDIFKARNQVLLKANRAEFWKAVQKLWPILDSRKFPYANQILPIRLIRWGLHPCIPIRLCLKLEWRQLFR